jgi:hypothetical protein
MRTYEIESTETEPSHGPAGETSAWDRANALPVDQFNWHEQGPQPTTTARLLYDEEALYCHFDVEDRNISASVTELNGPTFQDSSVELFADPDDGNHYFNFEVNCCGTFKLAWQRYDFRDRDIGRDAVPVEFAEQIDVTTSVEGPTREPRPDDEGWWLVATIPFETLSAFTGIDVAPTAGTEWAANVYRSGVASDSQKASWNPMPIPEPTYHSPEYFGRLQFQ